MINRQLQLWLHVGLWLLILSVYAYGFVRFMPLELSLLRGLANTFFMALLFYANIYYIQQFMEKGKIAWYTALLIPTMVFSTLMRTVINRLFPEIDLTMVNVRMGMDWSAGAIATNLLVFLFSSSYQVLVTRLENEQKQNAIIIQQNEAQLQFLRGQINPHFLFNMLNNIYSLAMAKSEKTAPMVLKLSGLLRYVIYDSRKETTPIQQEVAQIEEYIELQQMRSEEPLDVRFEKKITHPDAVIEPMILLPLVENCYKHAGLDIDPSAFVRISLEADPQKLLFKTYNKKLLYDNQKDKIGGIGLENIRNRLQLKYPRSHEFVVNEGPEYFEVLLFLGVEGGG